MGTESAAGPQTRMGRKQGKPCLCCELFVQASWLPTILLQHKVGVVEDREKLVRGLKTRKRRKELQKIAEKNVE